MMAKQSDKSDNHIPQGDFGPVYNLEPDLLIKKLVKLDSQENPKMVAYASQIQFQMPNIPAK